MAYTFRELELILIMNSFSYALLIIQGFKQCGSLNLARSRDRAIALKRRIAYTKPSGLQCEVSVMCVIPIV